MRTLLPEQCGPALAQFQNNRNHTVAIHQIGGMDQQLKRTQIERTISSKSKSKSKSVSKSNSPIPKKKAEAALWTTEEVTKEPNTGEQGPVPERS